MIGESPINEEAYRWVEENTLPPEDLRDIISRRKTSKEFMVSNLALWRDSGNLDERGLEIVNTSIPHGSAVIGARVYRPSECRNGKCGALLYFHGGGFVMGDLDTSYFRCAKYAKEAGVVVISIDYRLSPESLFPAALEDCYSALLWTRTERDKLHIDFDKICLSGDSAGGNLAASVSLMARNTGEVRVNSQLLIYPVLDFRYTALSVRNAQNAPILDRRSMELMRSNYLGIDAKKAFWKYASPLLEEDFKGLPATYLVVGEQDPLRDEGIEYSKKLMENGVSTEFHLFPGAPHAFDIHPEDPKAIRALDEQISVLKAFME